ncbi:MAG: nucleotidyltransferase domain-containing protein [Terriglobales bacterium]
MKERELTDFCQRIQAAAKENLDSIVLYGSAARDDFSEEYSDLNLLCIVRNAGTKELERLAPVVEWWTKSLGYRPPLILTEPELSGSADVFAIETLDMKAEHRILAGRDVLAGIEVRMNLHRVQLEHELRTMMMRLRQHYVLFAGHDENLKTALAKSVSSVVVMLRHAVIALGQAPPTGSKRNQVAQAARVLGVDAAAIDAVLDLREGRKVEGSIRELYDRYMQAIAAVLERVDTAAPKQQWQRAR